MPLSSEQQLQKDSLFFDALIKLKFDEAEKYLRQGANPTAVIPNNGKTFDIVADIFILAVQKQVEFLLQHAGHKIEFDRHPIKRDGSISKINLLQLAATACAPHVFAPIAKCADRNAVNGGKNVKALLNEVVENRDYNGARERMSFASYLIRSLDRELLLSNYMLIPLNMRHRKAGETFIRKWPYNSEEDYNPNENFTEDEPRYIEWVGPAETLKMLTPYGLDLITEVNGKSPLSFAQMFVNDSKNIEEWLECSVQCWELGDTISIVPGSYEFVTIEKKEYLHMQMTTCNKSNKHPVTFIVSLDWEGLVKHLEKLIEQQTHTNTLTHMYGATLRRHSEERRQLESLITEIPEVIIAKGTPNDSAQAGAYKVLCDRLMNKFQAEGLKKAGVFKANFTGNASRVSKAGYILKALASSAPVGGELLTNAIEVGADLAANRVQDAQDQANYDKLVGVNLAKLVVAIALHLCEELRDYNPKTVNKAASIILKQIDQLRSYTGETQDDLVAFLLSPVIRDKSLVKDHSSNGSVPLSVVPYSSGHEQSKTQNNTTRCCIMM